jgi:hypothetical protein
MSIIKLLSIASLIALSLLPVTGTPQQFGPRHRLTIQTPRRIAQPHRNYQQLQITPNAYGPGVNSDQYGRAIHSQPGRIITPGVYGPGTYADQYGRYMELNQY